LFIFNKIGTVTLLIHKILLSAVLVTYGQPMSENITWKIPEIKKSLSFKSHTTPYHSTLSCLGHEAFLCPVLYRLVPEQLSHLPDSLSLQDSVYVQIVIVLLNNGPKLQPKVKGASE
jgi:hypothetical protein